MIAANAGADLTPQPFRPVLRGLLLDRTTAALPQARAHRRRGRPLVGQSRAALVAAGEDRRALPGALPRRLRRRREPTRGARRSRRRLRRGRTRRRARCTNWPRCGWRQRPRRKARLASRSAEVMSTDPLVVAPEDTLGEVAEKMRARDLGSALVADYGRLIGILTSRDLLRAFAGRVHPSEARVREWMTAEPVAVSAATPIEAAVTLMTEYGFHHLPSSRTSGRWGCWVCVRRRVRRAGGAGSVSGSDGCPPKLGLAALVSSSASSRVAPRRAAAGRRESRAMRHRGHSWERGGRDGGQSAVGIVRSLSTRPTTGLPTA